MREISESRLERQKKVIQKWINNKYVGTLQAVTGFGKTYTAILAILLIRSVRENAKIIVVVPTIYLREQWLGELEEFNIFNIEILIINTACKNKFSCDLLIIDEVHTTGAEQFSEVFTNIDYKAIFCLTATLERADGKEELIKLYSPIIDTITLQEALEKEYISNYKLYNIPIELTSTELKEYQRINRLYVYYENLLGGKFEAWEKATLILNKQDSFSNEEIKNALGFIRTVNKRKQFLYSTSNKLNLALQIIEKFSDRKTVVFSESINFATNIIKALPKSSTIYHSKLTKKEKKTNIANFINNSNITVLSSVKALDTGMDIPNISLGITCAGSSRSLQAIQRLGRTLRKGEDKIALFFNIYLKDSQEEKWIRNKCYNIPNVFWIENLNEII